MKGFRNLNTLQVEAASGTRFRGHRMRWTTLSATLRRGTCIHCTMSVDCNTAPQPNGIHIGGEAVALTCPNRRRPKKWD